MLDDIRFVQGAIAKKDFLPALTHFAIRNGVILGYNGSLALCSPIDLDLEVSPEAKAFIKAIQTCRETTQLHLTPTKRLSVKSGSFKALINCYQDPFPEVKPTGDMIQLPGGLLKALKAVAPFIAEDASRAWARGILLRGQSAFATNNITIVEYWLGYTVPREINIPKAAVDELLRINQEPTGIQIDDTSVTFHFEGNRWMRAQLLTTEWPDVGRILNVESNPQPLPEGIWAALTDLKPFVDEASRVFLKPGQLATSQYEEEGAASQLEGIISEGCFNLEQFLKLEGVVDKIDLGRYPAPCLFFGDNIRGAFVGVKY